MSSKAARLAYAVTLVVLALVYYAVPPLRPLAVAATGAAGAAAIVWGVRTLRPERSPAWLLIASAVVLLTVGHAIFAAVADGAVEPLTYPGVQDGFYLAAYVPLAVGLLWLGRPEVPSRDWPVILDTVVISLAGSLLLWITLVRPAVAELDLSSAGNMTAVATWVGHVAVGAAAVRVMVAWRTNPVLAILGVAVTAFLVSDFLLANALIDAGLRPGVPMNLGVIDLGYLAFGGLCGAAATSPSVTRIASLKHAHHTVGPVQLAMLAVGLLVGPTALLVEATKGPVTTGVAIAVVSAVIGVLLLIRISLFARAYVRRGRHEQAMRDASSALVMAATDNEVIDAVTEAFARMLPPDAWFRARLVESGHQIHGATLLPYDDETAEMSLGGRRPGRLTVPVHSHAPGTKTGRVVVFTAALAELVELSPALQTLTEQAGSALNRIDLVARVRAAEREHYFRTLVLTSTDVTIISRNGRVDYATPSADVMFGRDVRGAFFTDLVDHHRSSHAARHEAWSDDESGVEAYVHRPDGRVLTVLMHRRDLTGDPTVNGVVTTLRDTTAEREAQRDLAHRASHDALTGMANAERFRDELRAESDTAVVADALSAVLVIDLDDFKIVNDTLGHEIGDGLLMTTAHRIRSSLRDGDLAARLGGDEFAVLLRALPDPGTARAVAQRISDNLWRPANVAGVNVNCHASIGLALARTSSDYDSLLRRADTALYNAKADGKGRWRQYQDTMFNPIRRRADQRAALEHLIRGDALTLHYQPIAELATGHVAGFEALLRNTQPTDDGEPPVSAEELVRIAEDTGLTVQLDDWVLAQALSDSARLNPPGAPHQRYVSVNVSARRLRQRDFVDHVRGRLATAGVPPTLLTLEITENLLVNEDEPAWSYLADLRRAGVRVAIDDYGTGYASLSYLRQPSIDILKIDRSFLQSIRSARTQTLLEAVIGLANKLGLDVIAEGVEDALTRDSLIALGCRYGQGFLYAPAMPIGNAVTVTHYSHAAPSWTLRGVIGGPKAGHDVRVA